MTTYSDHDFPELLVDSELNFNAPVAFFTSPDEAEEWILKNGKLITEKFDAAHTDSPCALYIMPMTNYDPLQDCIEDIRSDIYFIPTTPTYVFSERSYQMVMDENFIFYTRDYASENASYITYLKENGTIIKGSTAEEIERCQAWNA